MWGGGGGGKKLERSKITAGSRQTSQSLQRSKALFFKKMNDLNRKQVGKREN